MESLREERVHAKIYHRTSKDLIMFGMLNNKVRLSGSDVVLPVSKLAVGTTTAQTQFSIVQPDTTTVSGVGFTGPDGKQFGMNYSGSGLTVTEAGTTRMLFQNGGNIGVGVTSASAGFHIGSDLRVDGDFTVNGSLTTINTNATITHMLNVTNDGTGPAVVVQQTGAQPAMDVYDNTTLALRVANGGYVGINNTQPAQWLDVVGNMQSSGFQRSAYTIASSPAATLTSALPNVGPGALLGWNRNGTGAVCVANLKGTLSGGFEYVSYNADASFKQVCMTLDDAGNMLLAGSGSISGNFFLAGNSTLSGTVVTLSNLNRTGPRYSLEGPHENVYTTNDAYPVYQKLVWGHDNISMGFDTYFNGSQWLSGDTSTAFQIMKLSSNFMIRPSASVNTPGGTISWSSAGLLMDSTGRVGVNATPAHTLDIGGDINAATNIVAGGTLTTMLVNASTTNVTGLATAGSLSTTNLNVNGQSSLTGNLAVGSSISAMALTVSTITGSALTVIGASSLSGNVSVGPGTLSASAIVVTQSASLSGLLTNNVSGSLLLRSYDESVPYANTVAIPGTALPAAFLTKPISQTQLSSVNLIAFSSGTQSTSYSARITGYIQCPSTGTFTFRTTYQDGATVWLSTDKLLDAWTFQGSTTQSVSSALVLRQTMWIPLSVEHAVAGGPERLLIEWNVNGGPYTTLSHATDGSNFSFAYDMYEVEPTLFGTSYYAGRAVFNDTTYLTAGASLPNAISFTGNISELTNDAGFIASARPSFTSVSVASYASVSGTLTAAVLGINQTSPAFTLDVGGNINFSGALYKGGTPYIGSQWTSQGTNLYFTGGNVGVAQTSPQFTLDVGGNINFSGGLYKGGSAYVSSQWTSAGSVLYYSGGNVGINQSSPQATLDVAGSLVATSLGITGAASISGVLTNKTFGALLMRSFDDSGLYAVSTLTSGSPLPPACMSRTFSDTQVTSVNLSNQAFGSVTAYSLRIAGHIMAPQTGPYLFRTTARDGASLYIYSQKISENWLYKGFAYQTVGTLTMYQNMWTPIIVEHAASSATAEQLLIEWSSDAGTTYNTLAHGTTSSYFRFGYDSNELPKTALRTIFVGGKSDFKDVATFYSGMSLPNATGFTGNVGQLTNDVGYVTASSLSALTSSSGSTAAGTITGTVLSIVQAATISGNLSIGGEVSNNVFGSLTMRVYDDSGLYALNPPTVGNPLLAPFTTKPVLEQQVGAISLTSPTYGTISSGYSLKINGFIQPPATGTYLLRSTYRDGLTLYIGQQKVVDSWVYAGSSLQSVGTLTLYQNVWYNFAVDHVAATSTEQLLLEWSNPGGAYATLNNSSFTFAYDMKEVPPAQLGTSYFYGRANFDDVAICNAGMSLPNASYFSGKISELTNDSSLSSSSQVSSSTITGSVLSISQNADVGGSLTVGGIVTNNVTGSLTMRVYDDSGLYVLSTLTAGSPLRAPFTTRPLLEQQVGTLSLTNATYGSLTAYSLRITGYIQPPATGTYLIRSTYRDGLSLYVSQQKLVDSWVYSGSTVQSVGTLTLYKNVWYGFAAEHAAASSSAESLLIEWSNPGGTYTTMTNGSFTFAYDMKEVPTSLIGTMYTYGHANFQDVAYLNAGAYLPNATLFSGNTSELNNDAGFFKNTSGTVSGNALNISGTVSAAALTFTGTSAGTFLQLANTVATVSGTVSTTAYGAFGVTPGTALDRYALNAHRWWTGSTGTTSGTVSMQLSTTGLSLTSLTASVVAGTTGSFSGTLTAQSLAAIGTINSNGIIDNALVHQPNTYGLLLTGGNTYQTGIANNTTVTIPFNQYSNTTYIIPSVAAWGSYSSQYLTIPVTGIWNISAAITVVASASNELFSGTLQQVSPSSVTLDINYLLTPSTTNTMFRNSTVVKLQQGAQIAFRINSTFNSFGYYQQTINYFNAHLLIAM